MPGIREASARLIGAPLDAAGYGLADGSRNRSPHRLRHGDLLRATPASDHAARRARGPRHAPLKAIFEPVSYAQDADSTTSSSSTPRPDGPAATTGPTPTTASSSPRGTAEGRGRSSLAIRPRRRRVSRGCSSSTRRTAGRRSRTAPCSARRTARRGHRLARSAHPVRSSSSRPTRGSGSTTSEYPDDCRRRAHVDDGLSLPDDHRRRRRHARARV